MAGAYLLNRADSAALEGTEGLIALVRHIRAQIECFSIPVPDILARCPAEIYESCGYDGESPPASASELAERCHISDKEAGKYIERFFAEIGKGYRQDQLALCDYTVQLLEQRRRALAEQLPIKKKRNGALCMSGALAVVILLI